MTRDRRIVTLLVQGGGRIPSTRKGRTGHEHVEVERRIVSSGDTALPSVVRRGLRLAHSAEPVEPEIRTMIDRLRVSSTRRRIGRLFIASVSAIVIGAAVASWTERIHFTVNGAGYDDAESGWISAEPTFPLPVRFSDGSAMDLSPGARGRVAAVRLRCPSLLRATRR